MKAFVYSLTVAMLLVSLTACGTTQAEQPAEPEPATTSSQANEPITTPEPSETPEPEQATEPASTDTVEPQTEPVADPEPEQTLKPKQTTEPTTTPEPAQTTQGGGKTSGTDGMVIDGIIGSGTGDELTMSKEEAEAAGQGLAGLDQWAAEHQGGGLGREGDLIDANGDVYNPNCAINMN